MRKFNFKILLIIISSLSIIVFSIIGFSSWVISENKTVIPVYNFEDLFEKELSFEATYTSEEMTIDLAENGKINIKPEKFNISYLDSSKNPIKDASDNVIDTPINAGDYIVKIESKTLLEEDGVTKRVAYVNFKIKKATPVINIANLTIKNDSGIAYITTDTSPSAISLVDNKKAIYHDESPTDAQVAGSISMEEKAFTIGIEERACTFTPTDTTNFEIVNFNYSIETYAMVKFYDGEELVQTQYIKSGETATNVARNKTDYVLLGWKLSGATKDFDFSGIIAENISLYTHWGHSVVFLNETGAQIGEIQYLDHSVLLSNATIPNSSINYQYSGSYVWKINNAVITPSEYTVNTNIVVNGSREIRVYPTVNVYYEDKDNQISDFSTNVTSESYTNVAYGTSINISKQIRYIYGSYNGFYMTQANEFDWESLGTKYSSYYGNEKHLVYYSDDYTKLTIVVLCIQPAAIVSTGAISSTANNNYTGVTYYSTVNEAFTYCSGQSSSLYLRIYGEMIFASKKCRTAANTISQYNLTFDSVTFTVPKYTTDFTRFTLSNSVTLASNIIVILPYGPNDAENVGYLPRQNAAAYSESYHSVLTIAEGTTLTINGNLTVGGVLGGEGVVRDYTLIMNNGIINLGSSTTLTSYGYIKGTGEIVTSSGTTIVDVFRMYDWPGGANGLAVYTDSNKTIFPINTYSIHNISCKTKIVYNVQYKAYYAIYASKQWADGTLTVIGSGGLFEITKDGGYIYKSAEDNNYAASSTNINNSYTSINQEVTQRDVIDINADFKDNSVSIKVATTGITTSKTLPLPIGFMNVKVSSGTGNLSVNSYKFYPGSRLEIAEGATINIASGCNVIFFEEFNDSNVSYTTDGKVTTWGGYQNRHKDWYNSNNMSTSNFGAQIIVNGTLNCSGNLAGIVKTTSENGYVNINSGTASANILTSVAYKKNILGIGTSKANYKTSSYYAKMNLYNGKVILSDTKSVSSGKYYSVKAGDAYGWRTNTVKLEYDLNGGTSSGTISNSSDKTSGENGYTIVEADIPNIIPTRDYYSFTGWYLDKEGTIEAVGQTIYATTTLYAGWTPIDYNISYEYVYNGCDSQGYITNNNPDTYTYEDSFALLAPTDGDLVFAGWYKDQACTNQINEIINQSGNITLYGLWYPVGTVTITINYSINAETDEIKELLVLSGISLDREPTKIISSNTTWKPAQIGTSYNNNTEFPYYFDCWYFDELYSNKFNSTDFAARIEELVSSSDDTNEITLYGIVRNKNEVIFGDNDTFTYDEKPSGVYLYPGQSYKLPTGTSTKVLDKTNSNVYILKEFSGFTITGLDVTYQPGAEITTNSNYVGTINITPSTTDTNYHKVTFSFAKKSNWGGSTSATLEITYLDIDNKVEKYTKSFTYEGTTDIYVKENTTITLSYSGVDVVGNRSDIKVNASWNNGYSNGTDSRIDTNSVPIEVKDKPVTITVTSG